MFDGHYIYWRNSRFNFIIKKFGESFFKGKTLLELGAGFGDFGAMFANIGANVVSIEGREGNIEIGQAKYPEQTFKLRDLTKDFSDLGKFDIVLHSGLFYHLPNPEEHLSQLKEVCNGLLIFETECLDSNDPNAILKIKDQSEIYDQALNSDVCVLSPSHIEKLLHKQGFNYKIQKNRSLNAAFHKYDWEIENTMTRGTKFRRFRRLWICTKT